ncbi:hypothetical protein GOP47_0002324 [Adiantum capillus-veneris]|uniref:Uncharacterized protein n=1 Tax=Adiantum capillus-veneris TaxID=13818 RepID=A0A9D4VBC8_ADICA|nr:hypothetical protein GOP47_0002324 [Adiantum capillus-veneris]
MATLFAYLAACDLPSSGSLAAHSLHASDDTHRYLVSVASCFQHRLLIFMPLEALHGPRDPPLPPLSTAALTAFLLHRLLPKLAPRPSSPDRSSTYGPWRPFSFPYLQLLVALQRCMAPCSTQKLPSGGLPATLVAFSSQQGGLLFPFSSAFIPCTALSSEPSPHGVTTLPPSSASFSLPFLHGSIIRITSLPLHCMLTAVLSPHAPPD